MNRRSFIERFIGLLAGIISIPAINKANTGIRPQKNPDQEPFILAAICRADRFEVLKEILKPSSGFKLVRYSPRRAVRHHVSAAWIEFGYKNRQKHMIKLLNEKIPVLIEMPYHEEIPAFDAFLKTASHSPAIAGIALYHHFLPACQSARDLLSSGRIGKLLSVQVQINQPGDDPLLPTDSLSPEIPVVIILNLLQWLLSQPLMGIRVSRKETATSNTALSRGIIMGAMEDFPVRVVTIPELEAKKGAWNILFVGEKGQVRLGANNLLEIIDESGSWRNLSEENRNTASSAVRMCFEDFVLAVKENRQPEGKITDMLTDSILFNGIRQSLQTGKGEWLVEPAFGKSIRL